MKPTEKQMLEQVAKQQLKNSFIEGYPENEHTLREALGIAISHYCDWSGDDIMEIFFSALEDANWHTEAGIVEEWIERIRKNG